MSKLIPLIWFLFFVMRISPNPDESEQEDGDLDDISQVTEDRFILEKSELEKVDIEIINSNKKKSEWLVIQRNYICICHDKSIDGEFHYWICQFHRQFKCPFQAQTQVMEDGTHRLVYAYSSATHCCTQDEADVLVQKFPNLIKGHVANSIRPRYAFTYDHEKKTS